MRKAVDRLAVSDLTSARVLQFLAHLEESRGCSVQTRNQRLTAIRSFAGFVGSREPAFVDLGTRAAEICRRGGATLLVNADPEVARRCGAAGVHLTSDRLARMLRERPVAAGDGAAVRASESEGGGGFLVGASCHDASDIERARIAGCDFAVLGPVRETATHPGARVLRWRGFEPLARDAGLPVYAIGGLGDDDIAAASINGGQGVAAIRAFWGET